MCEEARPPRDALDAAGPPGYDVSSGTYRGPINNQFQLKPGQWTDDTSMGLCLADSILVRGGYDGSDARARYFHWCYGGKPNADLFPAEKDCLEVVAS